MRTPRSKDRSKIGVSRKNALFLRPQKKRAKCERVLWKAQKLENFDVLRLYEALGLGPGQVRT
jgi:hypothetical protein